MSTSSRNHINASFRDGVWTNLATGMGENYFVPFLILLGFSDVVSGFGSTIPMFVGTCFQLLSNHPVIQTLPLRKRIMVFLGFQAFFILLLILMGIFNIQRVSIVFGILSFYWAFGLSLLPAWNRLMGHTVPIRFRLKFFSHRLQLAQLSVVCGLLVSGAALYFSKKINLEKECFLLIFFICFVFKLLSLREFTFHKEYLIQKGDEANISPWTFIVRLKSSEQGKLILFLFFFYATVYFSSPFFAPYMIKVLKFNYLKYMMITVMSFTGRIFMAYLLKKHFRPKSMGLLLFLGCLGVSTTPFLWGINQSYPWLLIVEFLSGSYWSMFDLACIMLFFDRINDRERTAVMTYISFTNTLGMFIGTLFGGLFLSYWEFPADRYLSLFLCSSSIRFIIVLFIPTIELKSFFKKQHK